jgi:glutamate synthase (NADPH/NADH) large chain
MRLQPGRMFLVDTAQGRIVSDEEIKAELAAEHPYQEWLDSGQFHLDELPQAAHPDAAPPRRAAAAGLRLHLRGAQPAGRADGATGAEPIGSMGTDTPIAVLGRPRMLFDYFQQLFAQVTNPPLDAIREEVVTSLRHHRPEGDLLNPVPESCHQIVLPQPILVTTSWPSWSTSTPTTRSAAKHGMRRRSSAACTGRQGRRGCAAHSTTSGTRRRRRSRTAPDHRDLRPRVQREPGADPVAAGRCGDAPPPGRSAPAPRSG